MLDKARTWTPPEGWLRITTVDAHTAGEPFRVITGGYPELPGDTILDRRRYAREHLDHLRTALMWEPRGHADMYGCIVTSPVTPEADIGVLFMHNEGYSTMCGHGIIGIVKVALETGLLSMTAPETTVRIDAPAGLITAYARVVGGRVDGVRFHNVPSFVLALDEIVDVPSTRTPVEAAAVEPVPSITIPSPVDVAVVTVQPEITTPFPPLVPPVPSIVMLPPSPAPTSSVI